MKRFNDTFGIYVYIDTLLAIQGFSKFSFSMTDFFIAMFRFNIFKRNFRGHGNAAIVYLLYLVIRKMTQLTIWPLAKQLFPQLFYLLIAYNETFPSVWDLFQI